MTEIDRVNDRTKMTEMTGVLYGGGGGVYGKFGSEGTFI